jgi:hypothetical protein
MSNSSYKDTTKNSTFTSITSRYDYPKTSPTIESAYKTGDRISEKIASIPSAKFTFDTKDDKTRWSTKDYTPSAKFTFDSKDYKTRFSTKDYKP